MVFFVFLRLFAVFLGLKHRFSYPFLQGIVALKIIVFTNKWIIVGAVSRFCGVLGDCFSDLSRSEIRVFYKKDYRADKNQGDSRASFINAKVRLHFWTLFFLEGYKKTCLLCFYVSFVFSMCLMWWKNAWLIYHIRHKSSYISKRRHKVFLILNIVP